MKKLIDDSNVVWFTGTSSFSANLDIPDDSEFHSVVMSYDCETEERKFWLDGEEIETKGQIIDEKS